MDTLELLLKAEIPNLPEKSFKVKRLSELCGEPVVFQLRALPYNRAAEIIKEQKDDMNVHILLAGVVEIQRITGKIQGIHSCRTC